jgi:hypothetical protein
MELAQIRSNDNVGTTSADHCAGTVGLVSMSDTARGWAPYVNDELVENKVTE